MSNPTDRLSLLSWRPRLTIRARLTLSYASLVTGCGAVLITIVWVFMRFVPNYAIVTVNEATEKFGPSDGVIADDSKTITVEGGSGLPGSLDSNIFSVTNASDFLHVLLTISILALVVLALLSALIGWHVAGRIIRPLKAINEAATIAASGSFDHRVGLQGPQDEIRNLSDTFDSMLYTLGRSFDAHRRFAANASHELRTPLATTQTMIDVTLADPEASTKTLRSLAQRIHTVNRANIQTVESLLDLADIDQRQLTHEPVNLRMVVQEAIDTFRPAARHKEITVTFHPHTQHLTHPIVVGDPVLLRQSAGNLIQNAILHNNPGGTVDIWVSRRREEVVLTVTNTGDHVPEDILESLLEPFVRGAGRTAGATPGRGHGLGLPISASVAEAHGGSLRLAVNTEGGITAELILPQ